VIAVKPVRILLVEDSPTDVELTQRALRRAKVANELHCVTDGESALRYLRNEGEFAGAVRPELILLDLRLPGKSGLEVLEEVKVDPSLRTIPVIVLTTSTADEDVTRAYQSYVNAYIRKPIDFQELIEVVRTIDAFWVSIVTLPPGG
jgi:CheY-like chemotaxis protein